MDIKSLLFPTSHNLTVLCIALSANGTSSYRDAVSVVSLTHTKWDVQHTCILTDNISMIDIPEKNVDIIHVQSPKSLLYQIRNFVTLYVRENDNVLFTLSSHGYSTNQVSALRKGKELNNRSEYILVQGHPVMDYELFSALYDHMPSSVCNLCLVDTCHSGTMLDMEYISNDGGNNFHRSRTPLKKRPLSICISACNDDELAGEDISTFGGWGGKLICQFLDYIHHQKEYSFNVLNFFKIVHHTFVSQKYQHSHPVISFNC
jgi:hypothetical protein